MADQTDPKTEELGKQLAEQMQAKLDTDEAHRLATEPDEVYDALVLAALESKVRAAMTGFNDVARAADQLTMEKGSGMLQMYKANLPVFAAKVSHREVQIVPAQQNTPTQTYAVTGGPDEFSFGGTTQPEFLKKLLAMATSGNTGLK